MLSVRDLTVRYKKEKHHVCQTKYCLYETVITTEQTRDQSATRTPNSPKSHIAVQWEGLHPSHSLTAADSSMQSGQAQCAVQSEISTCCDKRVVIGDILQVLGTFKIYFDLQIRSVY